MTLLNNTAKAGFWIRALASWIDCLIIYAFLKLLFYSLLYFSFFLYFPFEFSFVVLLIIYSAFSVSLYGQTAGKFLMGIAVYKKDGSKLPAIQSVLRESVLKLFSGIVLFLGFLWIGFSKNKKGWHDYLCQSKAVQIENKKKFTGFYRMLALVTFFLFFLNYSWNFISTIIDAKKISASPASIKLPFMERAPSAVTDVSLIKDSSFVNWLDKNAQNPEDYVLNIASTHQVTLLGEIHENRDNLNFLNKLIEPLYYKSGVRIIAMEVIPSSMNSKVETLINGSSYDTTLALEIARSQCWKMWGWKEYWDVLETVWKLNRSLPKGAQPMRVVGIDNEWNMPNLSLLKSKGDDSKGESAFWEKFRVVSVIKDLPSVAYRDQIMARNIEREVFDKNQKAVVLIGFNHTLINYSHSFAKDKKIVVANPRFGVLLSQKYKNKLFQVELYQRLDINEENKVCKSSIDAFLDSIMRKRNCQPVGFTIANSPFENIRDSCSMFFTEFPSICYGDIAQGLIFLKTFKDAKHCTWQKRYISDEMYMNYKPMYELVFKRKFKNADGVNKLLIQVTENGGW